MALPFNGHWSRAEKRKFDTTIVFVHYFGGNFESTHRHQKFVNELGFDAVSFDLSHSRMDGWNLIPYIAKEMVKGRFRLWSTNWTYELREILDSIPGSKIIYGLSTPNMAALRLLATENRRDVNAWVADCGPYVDALNCITNYYRYRTRFSPLALPILAPLGVWLIGGVGFDDKIREWISALPSSLPILSIRCSADTLVPPISIEKAFSTNRALNIEILEIPNAHHLEGLKAHQDVYAPVVREFLISHASGG